jgi:hypothetical protein
MFITFVIGVLLIILTFNAYSNLGSCTSEGLRYKLKVAIILGTIFITIPIGYAFCLGNTKCNCDFGANAIWKINSLLVVSMGMGIGLLTLAIGIKNNLKDDDCNVDLGAMPDVLLGLSIAQISISIICIVAFLLYNRKDELNEGSKIEDVDDDSEALQAQSRIIATNTKRASRYKKNIANAQEELVNIRDKLEQGKIKQSDKTKYLADQERLLNEIKTYTSNLNSIGSVNSGEISSQSGS